MTLNLSSFDSSKLKNLKVQGKLSVVFRKLFTFLITLIVVFLVTILISFISLTIMYKQAYRSDNIQGDIRIDIQALSKHMLWSMASPDPSIVSEHIDSVNSNIEGLSEKAAQLKKVYSDKKAVEQLESDIAVVKKNTEELEALGNEAGSTGDASKIFYYFNDTMYPSIDTVATDLKNISNATQKRTATFYTACVTAMAIAIALVLAILILFALFIRSGRDKLTEGILEPVKSIMNGSSDMAAGKLDIVIKSSTNDELGELGDHLSKSIKMISEIVQDIISTLDRFTGGDFTEGTKHPELYIGDYAVIKESFDNISEKLSETLGNVRTSSDQVAEGAANMSKGASDLAEGATDQAAAVEELTASVNTVTEQCKTMADSARKSVALSEQVKADAENSAEKMNQVNDAMSRITEASKSIEQITNNIESIASETSLLALNASIEAARAGEAGRGFAVVADNISKLAAQSTEAAKSTHSLINDTLSEIQNGNDVVNETTEALTNMQNSVNEVVENMEASGKLAEDQVESMVEIDKGIDQISGVIQNNSATAEESSAVAQELTEQSAALSKLIAQFQTR